MLLSFCNEKQANLFKLVQGGQILDFLVPGTIFYIFGNRFLLRKQWYSVKVMDTFSRSGKIYCMEICAY